MTSERSVFLVTSGDYSAYSVDQVFATREAAQDYIDAAGEQIGRDATIDKRALHEDHGTVVTALSYVGYVTRDGEWHSSSWRNGPENYFPELGEPCPYGPCDVRYYGDAGYPSSAFPEDGYVFIMIHGTDHERVRKVFTETKARALAEFDYLIAKTRAEKEASRSRQRDQR